MASVPRSVVVGNAGGLPVSGFRFDGDETGYLDEAVVARIEPEHSTLHTDLSVLYSSVRLQGGAATLLPDGARITGLACINGVPPPEGGSFGWPWQSEEKHRWDDSLCVLCVDAEGGGAGVYYLIHDGAIYRWPQTVQAPHLCMATSQTTSSGSLLIGTPHGVYERSSDPRDTSSQWARLGSFARRVTRISVTYTTGGERVLWALVQDKDSGGKVYHGVYRYPPFDDAAASSEVEGGWYPAHRAGELTDALASGPHDLWYIPANADPPNVVHHVFWDESAGTQTDTRMDLPSGAQGSHLSHVEGVPEHMVSAVFCSVAGAPSPLYSSVYSGSSWPAFSDADPGGTLRDADGNVVGVNNVATSGLTFLGWVDGALSGSAGQYVAAWCCTTSGLFWCETVGDDWRACSGASGLADVSVGNVAAGQWIALLGGPVIPVNRVFVTNAERCYVSHSQTNLWSEAAPHTSVGVGPHLSALVARQTGTLPENNVATIGPMTASPLAGGGAHVHITGCLPDDWYWLRTLNAYQEWEWSLVNGTVGGAPRLVQQQVSDLSAESSTRVALLTASGRLAQTALVYLGEHSTPRSDLSLQTTFTSAEAAARRLRATMRVPVRYHGEMLARSGAGDALATTYLDLSDAFFFVRSVRFTSSSELGPGACTCVCELSTSLGEERSADDVAAAMLEQSRNLAKKHRH